MCKHYFYVLAKCKISCLFLYVIVDDGSRLRGHLWSVSSDLSALWTYYVGRGDPLARVSLTQVCACLHAWLYKWVTLSIGSSTPLSWQICWWRSAASLHIEHPTSPYILLNCWCMCFCVHWKVLAEGLLTSHLILILMQELDPLTFEERHPVSATISSSATHTYTHLYTLSSHRRSMGRLEWCQTE